MGGGISRDLDAAKSGAARAHLKFSESPGPNIVGEDPAGLAEAAREVEAFSPGAGAGIEPAFPAREGKLIHDPL